MQFTLKTITPDDNLEAICEQIQTDKWGADNEMSNYKPDSLRRYLEHPTSLLLLAYDGDTIAGIALCFVIPHPDGDDTLYLHEFDTHPNYRRQGVATMLFTELKKIAKERGLTELWVGADEDNPIAQKFYEFQSPDETDAAVMYSYKIPK